MTAPAGPSLPNPTALFAQAQAKLTESQNMDRQASGNRGQSARLAAEQASILAYLAVASALVQANTDDSASTATAAQLEAMAEAFTRLSRDVAALQQDLAQERADRQAADTTEHDRAASVEQQLQTVLDAHTKTLGDLSTRLVAVENRKMTLAVATAKLPLLALGANTVTLTWDRTLPDTNYGVDLLLGPSLVGTVTATDQPAQHTTTSTKVAIQAPLVVTAGATLSAIAWRYA